LWESNSACLPESSPAPDDRLTIISLSVLAYAVRDVLQEGLGHGVTAWLSGARYLTLSTVALSSDVETRWIAANGTLVNLLFSALFWLSAADHQVGATSRSIPWITLGAIAMLLFILVLGRGLTWAR